MANTYLKAVLEITSGTLSARPASGTVAGSPYFATDTNALYVWTGSAWQSVGGSSDVIDGVTVSGTPSTGQVPTATGSSTATWQTPTVYDASGAAATAQSNAETYANSLASNYDAAGSASTAQSNAETFATNAANNVATNLTAILAPQASPTFTGTATVNGVAVVNGSAGVALTVSGDNSGTNDIFDVITNDGSTVLSVATNGVINFGQNSTVVVDNNGNFTTSNNFTSNGPFYIADIVLDGNSSHGTSGQLLTSGGASGIVTWTSPAYVPTSTTVNGHALTGNVVVSASDITTGTLSHGQLPSLVSGDIPNNAANTSGTSAGLTGTPSITVNAISATTINGAALSGTFSGNATLSGNLTFTGTETSNNTCALTTTTAATASGTVGASPVQRWNGTYWTSGASTTDTWSANNSIATPATCTISNVSESAGNVVTLTVSGVTGFTAGAAGTTATFSGLTTATWLNGQNVTLTTASGTTMTFTDPTTHGTQASHAETGTVTQNNPAATLVLAHSGSATAQIQIPAANAQSNSPTMCAVGTTTTGISLGSNIAAPLQVYASGSAAPIQFYNSGVLHGTITNQVIAGDFLFLGQQATTGIGTNSMGATNTFPVCSIGMASSSSWASTTSGSNLMGVNIGTKVNQTGDSSLWMSWTPPYGSSNFQTVSVSPTINQSSVTNTVAGSALVSNVGAVVFSTANAYTSASCLAQVSVGTNTALNGTQTLTAQAQRAGSPYTITNSIENSSSAVTLNIGTHSIVANDWVYISGLTTETWLNGQTVKVTSVVANTSITFTDLTTHGTQATHSDTGTVACNYVTFALTHANITGSADTGTVLEQSTGLYTGILVNPTETATAPGQHMLLDLQVGSSRWWGITNKGHEVAGAANNDGSGQITSVSGTTVSKTFANNYVNTPIVTVTPTTNAGAYYLSAVSNSGFTVTYTSSGAQTFNYMVSGNPN